MLRKTLPYLLFLTLGLLLLYGPAALLAAVGLAHGAPALSSDPTIINADPATVAAAQQAGGWVQFGAVTSKLLTAAAAFIFFVIVRWGVLQLTHPAPARWAKGEYTDAFEGLESLDKFAVYQRINLHYVILAVGALVFAAVVQ